MKAAVFETKDTLKITNVEKPAPKAGEILVKVKACGVCATDVHTLKGESISGADQYPLIPGHEVSGIVEEVGEGVIQLNPGDKVAIDPIFPCGQCYFCKNNQQNHCMNMEALGTTIAGGFAEYVTVPAYAAYKFDKLDFDVAALTEPLATAIYGQERARVNYGDDVLIVGAGALGLLHLQLARVSGASRVTVVDFDDRKLEKAKRLGADEIFKSRIEPKSPDEARMGISAIKPDDIRDFAPLGYDVVIEATGVPAVVEASVRYLKRKGRLLVFGVSPHHSEVKFNPYEIYRNDWEIIGVFALNRTAGKALKLLEEGKINGKPVISQHYSLDQLSDALDVLTKGKADGKLQVIF